MSNAVNPEDLMRRLRGYTVNGKMYARIHNKTVELGFYRDGVFNANDEAKSLMRSMMPDMALKAKPAALPPREETSVPQAPAPAQQAPAHPGRGRGRGRGLPAAPVAPPVPAAVAPPPTDYVVGQGLQGVNPSEFSSDDDDDNGA